MDRLADSDYKKRYQSVRGYEALIRSLPKPEPKDAVESDTDLEVEIRKSLAAKVSESSSVWVVGGPESAPEKENDKKVVVSSRLDFNMEASSCESHSERERDEATIPSFTQIDQSAGPRIYDWASILHVDLLHRQGLHAPALILQYVDAKRSYYKAAYVDSLAKDQKTPFLYIRQKRKRLKFRMSSDEKRMCKHRNPKYVGKCTVKTCDKDRMICIVSSKSHQPVSIITVISKSGKHHVRAELTGEYLNWQESGPDGLVLSGYINNYLDPVLVLRAEQSNRAVLEIRKSGPLLPAVNEAFEHQLHAMVYLDYPMTIFLSAIICVMVDARRRGMNTLVK